MASNTSREGAGFSKGTEFAVYDALPPCVKKAFQDAPADFSAALLVQYPAAIRMRKSCTDEEYADWLKKEFSKAYKHRIMPAAYAKHGGLVTT